MQTPSDAAALETRIRACKLCAEQFAASPTAHPPRPVLQFGPDARLLIAGQAPGWRAHRHGRPFSDPSGDRLRAWLGVDAETFYDPSRVAILPMAFCFPGHDAKGGDRPPPRSCAETWRDAALAAHPKLDLVLMIGRYAQNWHAPETRGAPLKEIVAGWRARLDALERPTLLPTPHPSWRNNAWLKANPWFEADLLPALRARVRAALD